MATLSLQELLTTSFYAWETRGRGWLLADYPVDLEPPYRPFFVLPQLAQSSTTIIDDGKRPTLFSSLVDGARRLLATAEPEPAVELDDTYEEQAPFPAVTDVPRSTFSIRVPADYRANADVAMRLLLALSETAQPISYELIGNNHAVSIQLTCSEDDRIRVAELVSSFIPDASVIEGGDVLQSAWNTDSAQVIADFGLANEFFLPLQSDSLKIDPYIPLVAALAQAQSGETLCVQVLYARIINPWAKGISDALTDDAGDPLFADAPEFIGMAEEKMQTPLVAVVLRVAANAQTNERGHALAQSTASFFRQFGRSGGNELIPLENDHYPLDWRVAALLNRMSFRTGMLVSAEELVGLVHLPDASVTHDALMRDHKRSKAAPSVVCNQEFILGENIHRGERTLIGIPAEARLSHTHIIGASGTGKSTLLLNVITQDIAQGHGVALLDPHGDLVDEVLARIPKDRRSDVIVFDPSDGEFPIGWNVLSAHSEIEKNLVASDLVAIFRRLSTSWGDAMNTVLANAVIAILESTKGGTFVDLKRFLVDPQTRSQYLATIADPEIRFFWEKEFPLIGTRSIGPILTRLDAFLRPKLIRNIVGQQHGKLDIGKVVEGKQILLAKLSQGLIGSENAHLLGALLVSKFHQVALARQAIALSRRFPYYLYIDEFQHFVTPSMSSLLSETRKYGLGFTLAHQTLAQLAGAPEVEAAILGNAHTRIVFRVGDDDARTLASGFAFFEADDIRTLSRGEAIVRMGSAANDFNLRVFPKSAVDADDEEENRQAIIASSREQFGTPISALAESAPGRVEVPLTQLPNVIARSDVVSTDVTIASPPQPRAIPEQRARINESMKEPATLGRGGQEHKYLQHLVKRLAEERGFRATIEDPAEMGLSVDVVLRKDKQVIGCEISITTAVEHEIENLKKCQSLGFHRILFICSDKRRRERLAKALPGLGLATPVTVLPPDDLVAILDQLGTPEVPTESKVRGYKVKVSRQTLSPDDVAGKRAAIASVIARSLGKRA